MGVRVVPRVVLADLAGAGLSTHTDGEELEAVPASHLTDQTAQPVKGKTGKKWGKN